MKNRSYGVMYASIMTLFLVPCGYLILDDWGHWFEGRRKSMAIGLSKDSHDATIVSITEDLDRASGE